MQCPNCQGEGTDPWFAGETCDECEGAGEVDDAAYPDNEDEFDAYGD